MFIVNIYNDIIINSRSLVIYNKYKDCNNKHKKVKLFNIQLIF